MKNNNRENYVVLNGVKIEMSDELAKQLQDGIKESLFEDENIGVEKEVNKVENLFKRGWHYDAYSYIRYNGNIATEKEAEDEADVKSYNNINYFHQIEGFDSNLLAEYFHKKNLMQRKMMKFSLLHDGYKIQQSDKPVRKYNIYYNYRSNTFRTNDSYYTIYDPSRIYFYSREIAQQFINENEAELLELIEIEKQLLKNISDYCES